MDSTVWQADMTTNTSTTTVYKGYLVVRLLLRDFSSFSFFSASSVKSLDEYVGTYLSIGQFFHVSACSSFALASCFFGCAPKSASQNVPLPPRFL